MVAAAHEEEEGVDASRWPCCDDCGICTRSQPPTCECRDTSTSGCNPECKSCVRSISDGLYECKDRIVNFCKRRTCSLELIQNYFLVMK